MKSTSANDIKKKIIEFKELTPLFIERLSNNLIYQGEIY